MRGEKRTQFYQITLEKLAEIKKTSIENMDKITTNNFNSLS